MGITPDVLKHDLYHSANADTADANGGRMNLFYRAPYAVQNGINIPDSQFTQSEIPNYWRYARRYTLADHFFSTVLASSFLTILSR